jgi:hypothetical protein
LTVLPRKLRGRARYALDLPGYLRTPLSPAQCRRMIGDRLGQREQALLEILRRAVYGNPGSPYRGLLTHLGVELGDVAGLLRDAGVEEALSRLHEAGVRISLEEFKGRAPIRRPGLELQVMPADFENPLLLRHYEASTGGSRSAGNRVAIDLDLLAHEAAYEAQFLEGFRLHGRPTAFWRPAPPASAGLKGQLRQAKLGLPVAAWFSQHRQPLSPAGLKFGLLTSYTVATGRLHGGLLRRPRHVPLDRPAIVAGWLAGRVAAGTPALLDTNWSSAIRVCKAALADDLDLTGTFFRVGGESATSARAALVRTIGADFACHYSMSEVGRIGMACAERRTIDEVHLMTDKVAAIQRPGGDGSGAERALHLTTLLPSSPMILLNVDVGDHAVLGERTCGCPFGRLGLTARAHGIASHEKLTAEGMAFVAGEVGWLLEEALPKRLGGSVGDYQLVEERGLLPRVRIVVSPAVGELDEDEVVRVALSSLASLGEGQRLMAEQWHQGGTLQVERRPPYVTRGGKVQLLHVVPDGS